MVVGLESIASSYSALLYGIIGLLILAVVCHKWDAIVFFITEQPKLHISLLDYFHCFYRWTCGCCCGAWTRSFTSCCCGTCAKCDYCGCGCESVAGLPVSSMFGSVIGIIPRVIEVSDLVVGDLPFSGLGDFYITMETGSNPRQASSVMKDSIPKVTHFADKMILCVRDSVFERRVEFVVWELNVAGAERLCDVQLSARQLIDWALDPTSPPKRFAMNVTNSYIDSAAQPWICVELKDVSAVRNRLQNLETVQPSFFPTYAKVRLAGDLEDYEEQSMATGWNCTSCVTQPQSNGTWNWTRYTDGTYREHDLEQFKATVKLVDRDGFPVDEAPEGDLARISCVATCLSYLYAMLTFLQFMGALVWTGFRIYWYSCYRQYRWITVAELQGNQMPMTTRDLRTIYNKCQKSIEGIVLLENDSRRNCRPSDEVIEQHCNTTKELLRPRAFKEFADHLDDADQYGLRWFSQMMGHGIPCHQGVCAQRNDYVTLVDYYLIPIAIASVIFNLCVRNWINGTIRKMRKASIDRAASRLEKYRNLDRRGLS